MFLFFWKSNNKPTKSLISKITFLQFSLFVIENDIKTNNSLPFLFDNYKKKKKKSFVNGNYQEWYIIEYTVSVFIIVSKLYNLWKIARDL